MKKVILFVVMLVIITVSTTAQKSQLATSNNEEIANIIKMSAEANKLQAGIKNPNLIQPGKVLTFEFEDGTTHQIGVEKGDNQWLLVKNKLSQLIEDGNLVYPNTDESKVTSPAPVVLEEACFWCDLSTNQMGLLLLAFCFLLFFIGWLIKTKPWKVEGEPKEEIDERFIKETDPVTAGTAVIPGGIRDDAHADEVIQEHGQNIYGTNFRKILNRQFGFLHAVNKSVNYADKRRNQTFRNEPGYRGIIEVMENEQLVQKEVKFLQGCGNDIDISENSELNNGQVYFTLERITDEEPISQVVSAPVTINQEQVQQSLQKSTTGSAAQITPIDINQMVETLALSGQAFRIDVVGVTIDVDAKKFPHLVENHVKKTTEAQ